MLTGSLSNALAVRMGDPELLFIAALSLYIQTFLFCVTEAEVLMRADYRLYSVRCR